jgi:hypothetical protein
MLQERQIGFKSITENIDTTTSGESWCFIFSGHWLSLNGILSGNEPKQGCLLPEPEADEAADQKH